MAWLHQVLVALDQLINAGLGGYCDETLSGRAWRMEGRDRRGWHWLRRAIDQLFFWQDGHCERAHYAGRARAHRPPAFRHVVK